MTGAPEYQVGPVAGAGPGTDAALATTMFAFVTDLFDAGATGVAPALAEILDGTGGDDPGAGGPGIGGLTVAGVYHASRDVFPHGRAGRVRYLPGGLHYFRPDLSRYLDTPIKPVAAAVTAEVDPFRVLRAATAARSATMTAWLVYLHNDRVGFTMPEYAPRNAYGDGYLTDLCPAHPAVRSYAVALTRDVARYGCEAVLAESLHFHPLGHGNHHERCFVGLDPLAEFLLGLCFCTHCAAAGRRAGVDVPGLRGWVCRRLDRALAGGPVPDGAVPDGAGLDGAGLDGELTLEGLGAMAGGELGAYLTSRQQTVTSLVGEVRATLAGSGTQLWFLDQAGAMKGYATGEPDGLPAAAAAWQLGVDVAALASSVDAYQLLGYARDPRRVRTDAEAYRVALGAGSGPAPGAGEPPDLRCALRPGRPDCASGANLAQKLAVLADSGVSGVDFYHYGLSPRQALDRVHRVLRERSVSTDAGP